MPSGGKQKFIWIGLGLAILVVLIIVGPRLAASYYYNQGLKFYFEDNIGGSKFKEAKASFERSLRFNSGHPAAHMYIGRIALGRIDREGKEYYPDADWNAALPHYQKALDLGIENFNTGLYAHTLERLGNAYQRAGEYEKARELYLKKIERFPYLFYGDKFSYSSFWPRFLTAEMDFSRFNKPEEARDLLLPIANPGSSDPKHLYRVYVLLARIYWYFDDLDTTFNYATLALESADKDNKSPEVAIAHVLLAAIHGRKGDFALAESEIAKANDLALTPKAYNCALSHAYFEGKKYSKAIEIAKTASRPKADYAYSICLSALARSYLALDKKAEARKYFQEYLDLTAADTFEPKTIFVHRFREEFARELEKLR